jgi:hypothetical protein
MLARRAGTSVIPKPPYPERLQPGRVGRLGNSLIKPFSSLFSETFSLLIWVGNCEKSPCSAAVSGWETRSRIPRIEKFPVIFPVSREFTWRRVRSALRRQPRSQRLGENASRTGGKARQWRAFAIRSPVSVLPIARYSDRIPRKSPANTVNIPVFGRRRPETWFDHALRDEGGGRFWAPRRSLNIGLSVLTGTVLCGPSKRRKTAWRRQRWSALHRQTEHRLPN